MVHKNTTTLTDDQMDDLIKRFNDGDESAWKFLMDSNWDKMITIAINSQISLHLDMDVELAADVTQDAWAILYGRCKQGEAQFENIGQIFKWIKETQLNLLRNLRRKASTRNERPIKEDDNGETLLPSSVLQKASSRPVEDRVIRNQDSSWVWTIFDQALEDFDEVDQDIVVRRIILDEKSSTIAKAVNKPVDHVYRVTERAWTKLKNYAHAESFFLQVMELTNSRRNDEEA